MRRLIGSGYGVIVFAVCLFGATQSLLAQQGTSEISGKVTDEQGAVLPGVAIVVTNEATGQFRETISGEEGRYLASQLTPGRYKVVAKLLGFRTMERNDLLLQV